MPSDTSKQLSDNQMVTAQQFNGKHQYLRPIEQGKIDHAFDYGRPLISHPAM